ncbi:MAG: arginine--tRNA ligase [Candidatus Methylacidiphilales bacterium]
MSHYTPARQLDDWVSGWAELHFPEAPPSGRILPCQDPRFGHYQSNLALSAAKSLKRPPREVAQSLIDYCKNADFIETPEMAGPGFVNFRFTRACLEKALEQLIADPRQGILRTTAPLTIVVDFSGPNVAKEMHVGHIRSTILGDCIARILDSLGHRVIRDNHIGDWGTQFGKLILGYKQRGRPALKAPDSLALMQEMYQTTHQACEADPNLMNQARAELKKLQDGDPDNLSIWKLFREQSEASFNSIYQRLNISFDHTLGESFYNPWLKQTVQSLRDAGLAQLSREATVVFFSSEELKNNPFIVEKSDGAALYATTDLATLKYRKEEWKADEVIYVTDGRQQLHFKQLFETTRLWKLDIRCHHVWFGTILGEDNKPLKTRAGTPIRLVDLLDEATRRALDVLLDKRPDLSATEAEHMAPIIGIGALKYADLSQNRHLDYVFNWDKLLSFDGNTAPYLINAYVRSRSILRRAADRGLDYTVAGTCSLTHETELKLARMLLEFGQAVEMVTHEYRPHILCSYLFDLASLFHRFFEDCPVLAAESQEIQQSRMGLCRQTGDTLKTGLALLGIETLESM